MPDETVKSYKKRMLLKMLKEVPETNVLREYCISTYGLVDNELRKNIWPLLTGTSLCCQTYTETELKAHPSYHQVELDVNRLESLLPQGLDDIAKCEIRSQMMRLTVSLLLDNPNLHYYQGFHDICYIFLSVLGEEDARPVLNCILPQRFGLFMESSMDGTVNYMQLIFALLGYLRPKLLSNLEDVGLGPHFALAWIVTWFAHVLPETDDVKRLFDLFLSTDPLMLIYLSVTVIIRSDEEVESTTADFGMLHHTLLRLPKKHPVEELVQHSVKLYSCVPPDQLLTLGHQRDIRLSSNAVRPSNPSVTRNRRDISLYLGSAVVTLLAVIMYWWTST